MSRNDAIHEPFGDFPSDWDEQLKQISTQQSLWVREADVLRLKAWMVWEQIGHRYVLAERAETAAKAAADAADEQARAANRHADALRRATWVLAGATIGLFLATVALVVVTVR
jgi:hypothetical protein